MIRGWTSEVRVPVWDTHPRWVSVGAGVSKWEIELRSAFLVVHSLARWYREHLHGGEYRNRVDSRRQKAVSISCLHGTQRRLKSKGPSMIHTKITPRLHHLQPQPPALLNPTPPLPPHPIPNRALPPLIPHNLQVPDAAPILRSPRPPSLPHQAHQRLRPVPPLLPRHIRQIRRPQSPPLMQKRDADAVLAHVPGVRVRRGLEVCEESNADFELGQLGGGDGGEACVFEGAGMVSVLKDCSGLGTDAAYAVRA